MFTSEVSTDVYYFATNMAHDAVVQEMRTFHLFAIYLFQPISPTFRSD